MSSFGKTVAVCSTFVALAAALPAHASPIRMATGGLDDVLNVPALRAAVTSGGIEHRVGLLDRLDRVQVAHSEPAQQWYWFDRAFRRLFAEHHDRHGHRWRFHRDRDSDDDPPPSSGPPGDPGPRAPAPEPATLALLGTGLFGAGLSTRYRTRR